MEDAEIDEKNKPQNLAPNMIQGRTMSTFHLRPKNGFDDTSELKLELSQYIAEVMALEGYSDIMKQFKEKTDKFNTEEATYPKIVFLGTGSCIPNKTRNTSAILVHISETSCILLDCGEGTFGQIVRFYGPTLADKVFDKMKAIYISHLHADHHIGLIGVLQGRRKALNRLHKSHGLPLKKIYLLAPNQILPWLNFYDKRFETISSDYEIISNTALLQMASNDNGSFPTYIPKILEMTNIQTCYVKHCPNAFGIALTIGDKKITYSGDTIPCEELIKLGQNSNLLIHEATMEDELTQQARTKMHSTTSQAITVGNKMNAQHIILTHFSQRYARIPRLKSLKSGISLHNVGVAFDNMQVSLNQLRILPHMVKPLELIFIDQCQIMDYRAEKRKHFRNENPALSSQDIKIASPNSSPVISRSQTNILENADDDKPRPHSSHHTKVEAFNNPFDISKSLSAGLTRSEMAPPSRHVQDHKDTTASESGIIKDKIKGECAARRLVASASRTLTTSAFTHKGIAPKEIPQKPRQIQKIKKNKTKVASASRILTTSAFTHKGIAQKEIPQKPRQIQKIKKNKTKVARSKAPVRAPTTIEDSKKMFRSRKYREESKFEKIEGLNWISWKQ